MNTTEQAIAWPPSNTDFDPYYEGLRQHRLVVQMCGACSTPRFPPGPGCSSCGSLDFRHIECSGRGEVYSYTIHHRPAIAPFPSPHMIALVELEEGVRMITHFIGDKIRIGMKGRMEFFTQGDVVQPRFRAEESQ
jgi:uncharacterized OB-fold protein